MRSRNLWQVLCFVRTKHGASRLARLLEKDGLATSAIHGDKTQIARMDALAEFKDGKLQVLVATDVAARGLDVDDLPLVVNYELPHVPEDYIHRIGRTGRAGAVGEAISLVAPEEEKYLADIERMLKKKVDIAEPAGFDALAAAARVPMRERATRTPRRDGAAAGASRAEPRRAAPTERSDTHPPEPRVRSGPPEPRARSEREIERELAYARNPDQPLPARSTTRTGSMDDKPALHGHAPRGGHHGKARPLPALLMKRKAPEAQDA